jgi:hypothetical protein
VVEQDPIPRRIRLIESQMRSVSVNMAFLAFYLGRPAAMIAATSTRDHSEDWPCNRSLTWRCGVRATPICQP